VSKNGNLLLNIPLRGDGSIDEDEEKVLSELADWMPANGEAIYGTRPFTVFGEGAEDVKGSGNFNEKQSRAYTAEDIRFTTKGDTLYAFALAWPENGKLQIKTLAKGSDKYPKDIAKVELLGAGGGVGKLKFTREDDALKITLPEAQANKIVAGLRITPRS
jgi:alpha-L-fucosidase